MFCNKLTYSSISSRVATKYFSFLKQSNMELETLLDISNRATTTPFGATITFWDELPPEEDAMVQSLNSRSAGGLKKNLGIIFDEGGAEAFMEKFYSGYEHKSIADCGSVSGAIDCISMLAAKELQNWWAYNGQETSTRFIDVTGLGHFDPLGTALSDDIMKEWFSFYVSALPALIEHLIRVRPRITEGDRTEKESAYRSMIEKRAYDILGAFLPAGTKTNASCHMELRQWDDKLSYMVYHPLPEIAALGTEMLEALQKRYPATFIKKKQRPKSEQYRKDCIQRFCALPGTDLPRRTLQAVQEYGYSIHTRFQDNRLIKGIYRPLLEERPEKVDPYKLLNEAGSYRIAFLLDYRSHRDIQRQRSALQRVPILTTELGFEPWYLEQLPASLRDTAELLLQRQKERIALLPCDELTRQYYVAMGYKVLDIFTIPLADLLYIIELRTGTTVHPTVRTAVLKWYYELRVLLPEWVRIYANESADDFDIKRSQQDLFVDGKRVSEM